ncbi:unnamed protein product, partial [Ranitomeya imitator]
MKTKSPSSHKYSEVTRARENPSNEYTRSSLLLTPVYYSEQGETFPLRYRHIKRRCSDIDNDAGRCLVVVWSLESCHTDSSPATNDAEVPGTRGSVPTHYHTRLCPHTLPHEAPSPHITTRGSVPTHYHTRLRPPTLPHEAPSPHITTRGSVPTHYHMRLRPHTLPHEAPSPHITTRGSVPPHYHTRLRPHTLPHEALSTHITTRGSVHTHYHTRLRPHTLPHEAPSPHITTRGFHTNSPTHEDGNSLDLVFSRLCSVDDFTNSPLPLSDHNLLSFSIKNCHPAQVTPTFHTYRNIQAINTQKLMKNLQSSLAPIFSISCPDSALKHYNETLQSALDEAAPPIHKTTRHRRQQPWHTLQTRFLQRCSRCAEHLWRKSNLPEDFIHYKFMLKTYNSALHLSKQTYFNTLITSLSINPKRLFDTFQSLLNPREQAPTTDLHADDLANYFKEKIDHIRQEIISQSLHTMHCPPSPTASSSLSDFEAVTEEEVIHKHFYLKRAEIMAQCEDWIVDIQQFSSDKRVGRTMSHHAAALKRHTAQLREELLKLQCPEGLDPDADESTEKCLATASCEEASLHEQVKPSSSKDNPELTMEETLELETAL